MYKRTKWNDHVVQRPDTYTEVVNGDGSKTYTESPGEIIQQGTPQSATNFNNLEEGLQHTNIAFEMMFTITQAYMRELDTVKAQLAVLAG